MRERERDAAPALEEGKVARRRVETIGGRDDFFVAAPRYGFIDPARRVHRAVRQMREQNSRGARAPADRVAPPREDGRLALHQAAVQLTNIFGRIIIVFIYIV